MIVLEEVAMATLRRKRWYRGNCLALAGADFLFSEVNMVRIENVETFVQTDRENLHALVDVSWKSKRTVFSESSA